VVEGLHLAGFRGEELGLGAGAANGLQRLGQLDLLDALVRGQKRDLLSTQLLRHRQLLSLVSRLLLA
jgi:hypothetical protein